GVAGANFFNARIVSAGRLIGTHHQLDFCSDLRIHGRQRDWIEASRRPFLEANCRSFGRAAGNQSSGPGGMQDALRSKIVSVGVTSAFARNYPDAAPSRNALRGGL